MAADVPDALVLRRHRDLGGAQRRGIWARRLVLSALAAVSLLALLNVFGQRPETRVAVAPAASLELYAPATVRGGLLWSARFHVTAHRELRRATLVLDPGWAEGMAINTIEPSPAGEASRDGRLALELGHIPAGGSYLLFVQFQVNPTNVAWHRQQNVELDDGDRRILSLHRSVTIFP
ncbi:MAG TPA: hypothetical protein VFB42_09035 [Gaiellaceae bacterium]|nr:hypothetical protein [Gaiellaceae bacterium]